MALPVAIPLVLGVGAWASRFVGAVKLAAVLYALVKIYWLITLLAAAFWIALTYFAKDIFAWVLEVMMSMVGLVLQAKFVIRQQKTAKLLKLPIVPQLAAAIDAMPPSDSMCFLVTEWKKPFSVKGFGGWFREQCDKAGLPHCTSHGLRKATMRRMAEREMPNKTMKSVSGHSKDDEVARYTEAANQERLAEGALTRLAQWEMSNRDSQLDIKSPEGIENKC